MDFCVIAARKVDGTCGRSPDGHLRGAADRVPGVTTMDAAVFVEKFTTCGRVRANRRGSSPHLTRAPPEYRGRADMDGGGSSPRFGSDIGAPISRAGMRIAHR